ncbi:MAG: 16S rRNA (cytidine(1402)-2'-O)-methyltransferase [Rhizobiaceae bacterium]
MQNRTRNFLLFGHEIAAPVLDPALYLVATPIGNLSDITIRALETLAAADVVAAEDTRVSRVLLSKYGIRQKLVACHEHNEASVSRRLVETVLNGGSVALISDAGTPLVSDPGYRVVQDTIGQGLPVVAIPGPSAVLAALAVSGLPTDGFLFAGFLPAKAKARRDRLAETATAAMTMVFYESPRRLAATLADMADVLGEERMAVVARELTKRFEEVRRGNLRELSFHYKTEGAPKGEVVICVGPAASAAELSEEETDALLAKLAESMPASKAASEASTISGRPKRELYARLLALKENRQ